MTTPASPCHTRSWERIPALGSGRGLAGQAMVWAKCALACSVGRRVFAVFLPFQLADNPGLHAHLNPEMFGILGQEPLRRLLGFLLRIASLVDDADGMATVAPYVPVHHLDVAIPNAGPGAISREDFPASIGGLCNSTPYPIVEIILRSLPSFEGEPLQSRLSQAL